MKKLVFLGTCLWALAGPARAQTGQPSLVMVRIINGNRVLVTRGEGKTEQVELDGGNTMKGLVTESEGYHKLFSQLYQEGYTLQNSFSPGVGNVVTLLFVKR